MHAVWRKLGVRRAYQRPRNRLGNRAGILPRLRLLLELASAATAAIRKHSHAKLIIPPGVIQHWLGFSDQLAYLLERPDQFAPDVVLRSASPSVSETILDEIATLLKLERYTGEPYIRYSSSAPMRNAPFTYLTTIDPRTWLTFERTYGELTDVDVQLFRGTTAIRFTSPVTFRGGGKALVRLSGAALEGLPRRLAVANLVQAGSTWRDNALQVTAFAVNDYNFELHIPELPEVTNALLGEVTTRHQLSAKGKPGMAWLDRTDISRCENRGYSPQFGS